MITWLDFSGAPPLLIPRRLAPVWNGTIDTSTGRHAELDARNPKTDYDRACAAAWPGRGVLAVGDGSALALYSESDQHGWAADESVVACGGWLPDPAQLRRAEWRDPLLWRTPDSDFLLMNAAASGAVDLQSGEATVVLLQPGTYRIEFAAVEAEYFGCFHRFTRISD
jgi:hypothetical protein